MATPALSLGPAIESGLVDGCAFADIAWSAVRLSSASRVRIEESRISYAAILHTREGAIEVEQSGDIAIEHDQIDHFPSAAILRLGMQPAAVQEASNRISPPMIGTHGRAPVAESPAQDPDSGVPIAYQAIREEQFSAPTTPRPPSGVSAEGEDGFAYVTWIPCCLDGGSPVTAYAVTSSAGAKVAVTPAEFQAKGYVLFGGLDNRHPVTFTVRAENAVGSSPPSLATAPVTPAHKKKMKPPQAPAVVSLTTGKAGPSVTITPPGGDGGSPVIAYMVTTGKPGAELVIEGLDVIHADATHPVVRSLAGLSLDGLAELSVSARNAAGWGKPVQVNVPR